MSPEGGLVVLMVLMVPTFSSRFKHEQISRFSGVSRSSRALKGRTEQLDPEAPRGPW